MPDKTHFPAKAKRVIYLFQAGGPSQLDLFDNKPTLVKRTGQQLPESVRGGQRLTGMSGNQSSLPLVGSPFTFSQHGESGATQLLAEKVNCSVINAGDGSHEHPTQALLDALTIKRRLKKLEGLVIAICGDIAHSRVARSNIHLLVTMGAEVRVVAPPTLLPPAVEQLGVTVFNDMKKGLENTDIVMVLRLQNERMDGNFIPSIREYFLFFGLDYDKLSVAKSDALIMHPGPANRGVEIDSIVADDFSRSVIREQVEMGVAVRMACLEILSANIQRKRASV